MKVCAGAAEAANRTSGAMTAPKRHDRSATPSPSNDPATLPRATLALVPEWNKSPPLGPTAKANRPPGRPDGLSVRSLRIADYIALAAFASAAGAAAFASAGAAAFMSAPAAASAAVMSLVVPSMLVSVVFISVTVVFSVFVVSLLPHAETTRATL